MKTPFWKRITLNRFFIAAVLIYFPASALSLTGSYRFALTILVTLLIVLICGAVEGSEMQLRRNQAKRDAEAKQEARLENKA